MTVTGRTCTSLFKMANTFVCPLTWSPITFPVPHGPDHETVGAGPYHVPAPLGAGSSGYPNAVYYCSQNIESLAGAFCGRSDNGGVTYNVSTHLLGAGTPCGSITGHVKVAPDGTVYVPQLSCKRPAQYAAHLRECTSISIGGNRHASTPRLSAAAPR